MKVLTQLSINLLVKKINQVILISKSFQDDDDDKLL